jgi:hypothetical protein
MQLAVNLPSLDGEIRGIHEKRLEEVIRSETVSDKINTETRRRENMSAERAKAVKASPPMTYRIRVS